jgi:uncharacterized protein YjbI with pentapeptide repeats
MPEQQPAKSFFGFTWGSGASKEERLATPEELAEYGALAPDPDTEAKILALFEEQLLQDLIREVPAETVIPGAPAATAQIEMESPLTANEYAETQNTELAAQVLATGPGANLPQPPEVLSEATTSAQEQTVDWLIQEMQEPLVVPMPAAKNSEQEAVSVARPSVEADDAASLHDSTQPILASKAIEVVFGEAGENMAETAAEPVTTETATETVTETSVLDNWEVEPARAGISEELPKLECARKPEELPKTEEPPKVDEPAKTDELPKQEELAKQEEVAKQEEPAKTEDVQTQELPAASGEPLGIAEALEQHRLWVESDGAQGVKGHFAGADLAGIDLTAANLQGADLAKANLRGADLSMANLRNANLVEADLRDTNLLGTEFAGANLMGANLYGAQGLWAGRLGGANLFDATLPEAVAALTGRKTIEQFTQSARWFYLLLMGLCVAACGLIALTTDVRLILDESATLVARIPRVLPLQGFYLGAPLLLTAFYLRLQFLLLRLWGSLGALPAIFPDGQAPEKDGRWYLMGQVRPYLRWTREPRSAVAMMECYVAMLLSYWAVPAVLFCFWLRYLVMQDYRGTLLHLVLLAIASGAACAMPQMVKRVLRPGDWTEESTPQFLRDVLHAMRVPVLVGLTLFLLSMGVIRGLPGDPTLRPEVGQGDPRRWAATGMQFAGFRPYADLSEESVSVARDEAEGGSGGGAAANGPRLNEINLRYSRGYHAAFANARMWRANLEGSSLADADFRGANLREANMRSAKMDHVRADRANFVSADAQGAVFNGGSFANSDWSFANLKGATLNTANLGNATMYSANLQQANLLRADMTHTDLRDAHLEDAVLSMAKMEQTDFSAAKLVGANLTGAQAKGTIFLEADLSKADLRGGTFAGAVLRQVKLDGANVMGADFRGALGLEAWQVCATQGWRGAQFDADVQAAVTASCGTGSGGQLQ